jgi:hypothetical protein
VEHLKEKVETVRAQMQRLAATAVQLSRVLDALRLGVLIPSEVVTAALHEYRRFRFYSWDPAHSPSTRACLDEEF